MKYEIKQLNDTDAVVILDKEPKINDWYNSDLGINKLGSTTRYVEKYREKVIATISPFKIEELPMLELPNPAYDWFASKSYLEQHSLSDKYFESRNPSLLTNEQVTEMYKLELPNKAEDFTLLNKVIEEESEIAYLQTGSITSIEIVKRAASVGYKAAQKQYSEDNLLSFGKFCIENNTCDEENRYYEYWELVKMWKEQQIKTIYYVDKNN
jgi:hypothetical protein